MLFKRRQREESEAKTVPVLSQEPELCLGDEHREDLRVEHCVWGI